MKPALHKLARVLFGKQGWIALIIVSVAFTLTVLDPVLDPIVAEDLEQQLKLRDDIQAKYGTIIKAEFQSRGSRRAIVGGKTAYGRYVFKIDGDRSNGKVAVRWKVEVSGIEVQEVDFL